MAISALAAATRGNFLASHWSRVGGGGGEIAELDGDFAVVKLNFMICKLGSWQSLNWYKKPRAFEAIYVSGLLMQEQPGEIN